MKGLVFGMVIGFVMALTIGAGGDVNEPNIPNQQQVAADINGLKSASDSLSEAVYFGTLSEVLEQRIADVNAVCEQAKVVVAAASANLEASSNLTAKQKEVILTKLDQKVAQVEAREDQVKWGTFVKDVTTMLDPARLDPADPNYAHDVAQFAECSKWVIQICGEMI